MSSSESSESESFSTLRLPFVCPAPVRAGFGGGAAAASCMPERGAGASTDNAASTGAFSAVAVAAAVRVISGADAAGFGGSVGFSFASASGPADRGLAAGLASAGPWAGWAAPDWSVACPVACNMCPSWCGLAAASCFSGTASLTAAARLPLLIFGPLLPPDRGAGCGGFRAAGSLSLTAAAIGRSLAAALSACAGAGGAAVAALCAGTVGDLGIRPFSGADAGRASPKGLGPPVLTTGLQTQLHIHSRVHGSCLGNATYHAKAMDRGS